MTKGWYGNKQAHSLASKGIKSKSIQYKAKGKRRFRKGEFIEVMDDYSFIESHMGRRSNEPITVKKGDIGQITYTYKDDLEGVHITFKTKDGNVYFDNTDKRFISGKFRKLKMSKPKDKSKINTIFYEED